MGEPRREEADRSTWSVACTAGAMLLAGALATAPAQVRDTTSKREPFELPRSG